jgi:hypothetical protein
MSSYKIVKEDEVTGWHIAKVTVGGSVWFLKDRNDAVHAHGKYRDMLSYFKHLVKKG